MAKGGKNAIKSILLLLLIIMISAGGLVWFDYLGVIDIKTVFAPVLNRLGMRGRSQPQVPAGEMLNINAERLAVLIEGIDLQRAELDKQKNDLDAKGGEIEQQAAELEERQRGLDDREKALKAEEDAAAVKDKNLRQQVAYYNNMPPNSAVPIIVAMDDQEIIDLFRKAEEVAAETGGTSLVAVWLMNQQFPPARAAELSRKMVERP
jgi:flagellar protein FlbB